MPWHKYSLGNAIKRKITDLPFHDGTREKLQYKGAGFLSDLS
jgi:hypothetical protein